MVMHSPDTGTGLAVSTFKKLQLFTTVCLDLVYQQSQLASHCQGWACENVCLLLGADNKLFVPTVCFHSNG